jgi:two-component system, sensor histidine kinase
MITESPQHLSDWTTPARTAWIIRERIAYERVALMIRATPLPVVLGLGMAVVIAALLTTVTPWPWALLWLASLGLLGGWRLWEVRRFEADSQRRARAEHWRRRYLALLLPFGLLWSAMLLPFVGRPLEGFAFTFVLVSLLAVASVGVYTTHSVFGASAAWLGTILGPLALFSLAHATLVTLSMTVGTAVYFAVMLREAWRSSRVQAEMLRLRLENAAIAEERSQALALAEQHSRAKTRFLATVSHEMRTPLNGIVGISELMRDEAGSASTETTRERADVMLRSAEQLNRVIGDLLDLSRLEFGRLHIDAAPFDPTLALHEVLALVAPQAAQRGLALRHVVSPAVPALVSGDAARVKQVLHNLLANALRFTAVGQVQVLLEPAAQGLRFVVSDTGPGIEPALLATLFDPFDRPDSEVERRRQGVGLGLTIARRLARAMGGDLVCESTPGRGSSFSFTVQAAPVTHAPPAVTQALPKLAGRVLVVDDNEVNALVAEAMLKRLGVAADRVVDGQQALAAMASGRYAAVLMDCRMPVLDGWSATRRWRLDEAARGGVPRLPIIGVTANVSAADREHCHAAGMDDFLAKPFRIQELAALLQPHLARAEPASPQPAGRQSGP